MKLLVLIARLALIPFILYTIYVVWHTGYMGLLQTQLSTLAGGQVFVDLVVALTLVLCVMAKDARRNSRRFVPWLLLTLTLGSIGPLLYFSLSKQGGSHE
jgi:uncharacterized membrane protein